MNRITTLLLAALLPASLTALHAASVPNAGTLLLEEAIRRPAQSIPPTRSVQVALPPLPARPGKAILLRLRAVCQTPGEAGCNFHLALRWNGAPLGRYTAGGDERFVGRSPTFEFRRGHVGEFHVFGTSALATMFAPDAKTADAMTADGLGGTYCLDISDVARGVDGNMLTIENMLARAPFPGAGNLLVDDIEVGWFDRQTLPKPKDEIPARGPIAEGVVVGGLRLSQARKGGFGVRIAEDVDLLVETALGIKAGTPAALAADDAAPIAGLESGPTVEKWGPAGYQVTATWPAVKLARTIEIRDGLVVWKERWTNTGAKILGVPFRHRVFLRGQPARFWLGGSRENTFLAATSQNPTLYLDCPKHPGAGAGVTAESNWLRLLMWSRARAGVAEIYSQTLALAPGCSIDFELSIAPVRTGGYWSFINGVRRRWGLNGITVPCPIFFGYARAKQGANEVERIRNALGHLGPVMVALGPWLRGEPDARVVTADKYPRLSKDAPRAPGGCPDLDVEAFLTLQHREAYWKRQGEEAAAIRRACPQAKVIGMMHPSMEAVYKPLQHRWPIAAEAIKTRDGATFEDGNYSRAWLYDTVAKGWGVLYYVPRPGSRYLDELLRAMRRAMDQYGADGMYCDEFSWAYTRREYSRYDHGRWDGYSADLDAEGNVVRLKSDNASVTESAQIQIVREALRRNKFFLANGAASLRSATSLPYQRFVEGGNGTSWFAASHLNPTPLVLGNMGDQASQKGVFESVRKCLSYGCLYSPMAVNLVLKGSDNFVCKLYPMTVRELRCDAVLGEERLVTAASGSYAWPGRPATIHLYQYDAEGDLLGEKRQIEVGPNETLTLKVPPDGLAIAEIADSRLKAGQIENAPSFSRRLAETAIMGYKGWELLLFRLSANHRPFRFASRCRRSLRGASTE